MHIYILYIAKNILVLLTLFNMHAFRKKAQMISIYAFYFVIIIYVDSAKKFRVMVDKGTGSLSTISTITSPKILFLSITSEIMVRLIGNRNNVVK